MKSLMQFKKKSPKEILLCVFWSVVMLLVGFSMLVPFFWMLSASMKVSADVMTLPIQWIPDYFNPNAYVQVWNIGGAATRDYQFGLAYFNSIKIAVICVAGAVITSTMCGYAFAKIKFRGSNAIFLLYLATMMIPQQVTLIPKFVMFSQMGLLGTHYTLILPGIFTVTGTFLMRQFFLQVPNELREAAIIDGASEFRTWASVMVPIAKPSMASLAMVVFLWSWNNYLNALVYLTKVELYTIPVSLTNFILEASTQYNLLMAAAASAVLPVFVVFLLGQKFFIKGLVSGAVKG